MGEAKAADFPDAEADKETDKAIHVLKDTKRGYPGGWIPKSVIHDDSEVFEAGHSGKLVLHHWWAEKNGWL